MSLIPGLVFSRRMSQALALLLPLFAAATVSAGDAPVRYRLDDCIRIGLEKNAGVANARRDREIAASRVIQARATALPHVSVSAGYTRLDELQSIPFGEGGDVTLGTLDNYTASLGLTQLLYSGGKVGAALRAADLVGLQAKWACAETERTIIRDIKLAFYDVLLASATVDVAADSMMQLERLLAQTEERKKNGAASDFDVLQARVRVANEKPGLVMAKNTLEVSRERLGWLLNMDGALPDISGTLTLAAIRPDSDELQRDAASRRPAIRAMESVVELRREAVVSSRSDGLPSVNAQVTYNGANSYEFVSYDDQWQWHWNAGLVLRWNVWDGGLTRGAVLQSRLEEENALESLDEMRKTVKLEIRRYCLDLAHAREAAEAGAESVALAKKAMEIMETRHKQGLATYLEFSDANLALSTANLARLRALHAHMSALANLELVCGTDKFAE